MIRWQRWVKLTGSPKTLSKLVVTKDLKPKLWVLAVKYNNTIPNEKHPNYSPLKLKADVLCLPSALPATPMRGHHHHFAIWLKNSVTDWPRYCAGCWGPREKRDPIPAPKELRSGTGGEVWGRRLYATPRATRDCAPGAEAVQANGWHTVWGAGRWPGKASPKRYEARKAASSGRGLFVGNTWEFQECTSGKVESVTL